MCSVVISLEHMPRSGIVGLYSGSMADILWYCQIFFQKGPVVVMTDADSPLNGAGGC